MANYLVTGAGGSIGSELCEQIIKRNAEKLTLVSLTESGLYNIERKLRALGSSTQIVGVLGSAGDMDLMREVCASADVVIHAGAHKHVPICEANPIAAIENNVRATFVAATAAEEAGVKQFLFVSTDKAVRPKSVMGATKRLGELLITDKGIRSDRTKFSIVRFGNVLDSAGSVLPLWREQIAAGGPITLTDKRCERYFMSIPDACDLILGVLAMKKTGTFVFDMGKPKRLFDLAKRVIDESGSKCEIETIGLRPGEKISEDLNVDGDLIPTINPKIFEVKGNGKPSRSCLIHDALAASSCRNEKVALNALWSSVCWLKFFCLGIPKSGTCTIQGALESAGFRVAHSSTSQGPTGKLLCLDHAKGADPTTRLPFDAIVHPSVCAPEQGLNYWPQMDLKLLESLRKCYPDAIFCLNTRSVSKLVNSIKNWKDQQRRYRDSNIPGLPKGVGDDKELVEWVRQHWMNMREFFAGDPNFVEINIEDASQCKKRLSAALGVTIKEWPWLNRNVN